MASATRCAGPVCVEWRCGYVSVAAHAGCSCTPVFEQFVHILRGTRELQRLVDLKTGRHSINALICFRSRETQHGAISTGKVL
jgi:hypothetical protein